MSYHLQVLCALVRLSRRNSAVPSRDSLLSRAGGSPSTIADALRNLESLGLLTLNNGEPRLTLDGLALGAATSSAMASAKANEATSARSPSSARVARVERRSASRRMTGAARPASARRAAA